MVDWRVVTKEFKSPLDVGCIGQLFSDITYSAIQHFDPLVDGYALMTLGVTVRSEGAPYSYSYTLGEAIPFSDESGSENMPGEFFEKLYDLLISCMLAIAWVGGKIERLTLRLYTQKFHRVRVVPSHEDVVVRLLEKSPKYYEKLPL